MTEKIFFSIIVPTYNREAFIGKTLESILKQTYTNFEIIVVDDGSNDNTENIVLGFKDERIYYYKKINEERAAARNYGIKRANGNYITFIDSDDILYNYHFEEAVNVINKYNNPEWIRLNYNIKDSNGNIKKIGKILKNKINEQIFKGNFLACIGVFLRKDIAETNLFNSDRELSGSEDYELWLRLSAQFKLQYSNKVTATIINHDTRSMNSINASEFLKRIKKLKYYIFINKKNCKFINKNKSNLVGSINLFAALHLLECNSQQSIVLHYFLNGIKNNPNLLLTKRPYALIKKWVFQKINYSKNKYQ